MNRKTTFPRLDPREFIETISLIMHCRLWNCW